ncbi:hypothetical protein [uncultured Enterococcus sp.]|uniref:hypothetical protein n=1 Tax=uncultured Enterococcus sp. TaxID=167972 RepID=UPI0025958EE8|nr:hypothetical protein [uncultured Enterococcus sp.]
MEYASTALAAVCDIGTRLEWLYGNKFRNIRSIIVIGAESIRHLSEEQLFKLDCFHMINSYVIKKEDDYFCGLRADHFVVEEGFSEDVNDVVYLITANHKGNRAMTMIEMGL